MHSTVSAADVNNKMFPAVRVTTIPSWSGHLPV